MEALRYYSALEKHEEDPMIATEDDYCDWFNWLQEEDEYYLRECIYLDGMQPGDDYFDEYVEKFVKEIRSEQIAWRASSSPLRARLIMNLHKDRAPGSQISKAVLSALGPITGYDIESWKFRPIYQVIMFLDMVEEIETTTNQKIELYAQDPEFKGIDKAVLRRLDFTILEYPQAEELRRSNTFYFVAYGGFEWELFTSPDGDRPALMVGLRYSHLYKNIPKWRRGRKRGVKARFVKAKHDYRWEAICPEDDPEISWREHLAFGRWVLWCKKSVSSDSQ